ncbi:RNA polymerase-associated protein LEO1 [Colletotrichum chlorophyti]|uniref:RNA polymerase-associated protein LEO1 n=1 Tax=Colletotrichum chlorophyti TaxID=708187 RepID=A0A1Q8RVY5_9PEZI|nr:RNA polymerase-associated protein LEO1 [Colletotrichum chlorophyti]
MSDSEDDLVELPEEEDEDLFGDEPADAEAGLGTPPRSDGDAASDQDAGEGYGRDDELPTSTDYETKVIEAVEMQRHRIPKAKDQRLHSLRVPKFMRIIPTLYDPDTFEPTEQDIENARAEIPKADVRVRRQGNKLQSNAMVHRWSDGSVTVTVGDEHFEVTTKQLAPGPDQPYSELQDGHYYAAAAEYSSNFLMFVGHVTEQYIIRPGKEVQDDALIALAERMATVSQKPQEKDMIINTIQDPELRKRQAEQAEKERMKMQRRRETQAARTDASRGYGRSGGLSIGDLEGGRRAGGSRKRGMPGAPKQKRRRPEYDSDDDLPSGARRGDDYDMEDDFIVASDEEVSEGAEDDEEEILDDDEDERPRSKKRQKMSDDEDADGDEDDMEPSGRGRRRHVVDDDDSE